MGGGCQVPYAGHATVSGEQMRLIAAKFNPDGGDARRTEVTGAKSDAAELGERAAQTIS